MQHVRADLRAEVDVLRLAALARDLLATFALLTLDQLGAQHRYRLGLIGRLRALVLALDDNPGRLVRDPDRRVGLVDVLAAGTGRAVGVDLQVVVVYLDVIGPPADGRPLAPREARLWAVRGVKRRQPHEPVHALLRAVQAVGVL